MENNKTLAIFDMAIKISENTPVDVIVKYYPPFREMDVIIYWDGYCASDKHYTIYVIPLDRQPRKNFERETSTDDMLGILEEIWAGRENG